MASHVRTISSYPIVMNNACYYGSCSTSATTSAKAVTCANFQTLETNAVIFVRFTAANTSSGAITLNVNSTGEKTIKVGSDSTSSTNQLLWASGATIGFVYDGTNWTVLGEPRCWYGTSNDSAGTSVKAPSVGGIVVCKGTVLMLGMAYANTSGSMQINVSSTGAKYAYYGTSSEAPTTASGHGWEAGELVAFVFDGSAWRK